MRAVFDLSYWGAKASSASRRFSSSALNLLSATAARVLSVTINNGKMILFIKLMSNIGKTRYG